MIDGHSVLAVIPARAGSKRVPHKNLREVAGRPLIAWTIEQARAAHRLDRVVLSTEDEEIARLAREYGCDVPFLRPVELAADDTPGVEPVLHAITQLPNFDYVVLLQPTSPQRTAADIDGAIEQCVRSKAPSCVSVTPALENPALMYTLHEGRMRAVAPDHAGSAAYVLNGAVYVARIEWLTTSRTFVTPETIAFIMPRERSLDIDTEADLERFAATVSRR